METLAFFAAKAAQRADLFIAHESLEFFAAKQSARDGFPNREIALLIRAGKTLESLDDGRTALWTFAERLAVRHMFVGMKMLRFADDFFGEMPNVSHECVARKLAMLDFA